MDSKIRIASITVCALHREVDVNYGKSAEIDSKRKTEPRTQFHFPCTLTAARSSREQTEETMALLVRGAKGGFPGVPPGTYYLFIATRNSNHQLLFWGQKLEFKPGENSVTLDMSNAVKGN